MITDISALIEEQRILQIDGGTSRTNTIDNYSCHFEMSSISWEGNSEVLDGILQLDMPAMTREEKKKAAKKREYNLLWTNLGLKKLIGDIIKEKGYAVWVDLGCGNGVALRQGKIYLESIGVDPKLLRTYGIDALSIDNEEIRLHISDLPDEYEPNLLSSKYRPKFRQADLADVRFPEKPDLITAFEVMFWIKDPLKVFANAANQAGEGAVLCFNRINLMLYSDEPDSRTYSTDVFGHIDYEQGHLPGFKKLHLSATSAILVRTSEQHDFTYGLRLHHTNKSYPNGFAHVYSH